MEDVMKSLVNTFTIGSVYSYIDRNGVIQFENMTGYALSNYCRFLEGDESVDNRYKTISPVGVDLESLMSLGFGEYEKDFYDLIFVDDVLEGGIKRNICITFDVKRSSFFLSNMYYDGRGDIFEEHNIELPYVTFMHEVQSLIMLLTGDILVFAYGEDNNQSTELI